MFAYTPRPNSTDQSLRETMNNTKKWTYSLKQDHMVSVKGMRKMISMSSYVASVVSKRLSELPFSDFFDKYTALIPIPGSSQIPKDGLWVPERLATEMVHKGIGYNVFPCLTRKYPIRKSALASPGDRPSPLEHYSSISVNNAITDFNKVVLIDDVITKGSTLIGAANILHDAFPEIEIKGFAAIRTMSDPSQFRRWFDPIKGTIKLRSNGDSVRNP